MKVHSWRGGKRKTLNFLMIRVLTTKEDFKRIEDVCMAIDIENQGLRLYVQSDSLSSEVHDGCF